MSGALMDDQVNALGIIQTPQIVRTKPKKEEPSLPRASASSSPEKNIEVINISQDRPASKANPTRRSASMDIQVNPLQIIQNSVSKQSTKLRDFEKFYCDKMCKLKGGKITHIMCQPSLFGEERPFISLNEEMINALCHEHNKLRKNNGKVYAVSYFLQ